MKFLLSDEKNYEIVTLSQESQKEYEKVFA